MSDISIDVSKDIILLTKGKYCTDNIILRYQKSATPIAFINVKYPAGYTCTCTDGDETLRAGDRTGVWTFPVTQFGSHAVSTSGSEGSKSETVTITTAGTTVDVNLCFVLYVFNGSYNIDYLTGGWTVENPNNQEYSIGSTIYSNATTGKIRLHTRNKIDTTGYTKYNIKYKQTRVSNIGILALGLMDYVPSSITTEGFRAGSRYASAESFTSYKVGTVDISNLAGNKCFAGLYHEPNGYATVSQIWLS